MKRMVSLLLTLVLALLLAGCGGNAAAAADSAAAPRDNGSGYWNTTADTDSISEDQNMAYEAEEPGASAYNDSKAQSDRPAKKVYTGYMEMQTLDFDKASGDIDALVKELGGYFQQSSVSNRGNSGYRYGSYTIRIPSAQFDTFLQKAGTLCHLVYSSTGTDDVSETYYDTEARLETVLGEISGAGRVSVLYSDEGVAVVCEGASSAQVRLDIVNAVSAYTGFGSDRIKVLGMERSD